MNGSTKARWFSSRAIWAHVTLIAVVPTFLALADWQIHRALSGNYLSWAYAVEWPVFVIYAFYTWHKIIYDDPKEIPKVVERQTGAPGLPALLPVSNVESTSRNSTDIDESDSRFHDGEVTLIGNEDSLSSQNAKAKDIFDVDSLTDEDEELLLYNEYLSQLNKEDKRKSWF